MSGVNWKMKNGLANSDYVAYWRSVQGERALDPGHAKFLANKDFKIRDTKSRRSSRYSRKDDQFIVDNYKSMGPRVIAERLSRKGRDVTRNMVIGRYNRIRYDVKPSDPLPPPPECKAVLPPEPRMKRAISCGEPGCRNQPIPYSRHGLCSIHNAEELAKLPRVNRSAEISTSVSAGYMG